MQRSNTPAQGTRLGKDVIVFSQNTSGERAGDDGSDSGKRKSAVNEEPRFARVTRRRAAREFRSKSLA
jgi:hypothetical protein